MFQDKTILTPAEAAEYLAVGRSKIYEIFRSEGFPVLTLGKLKRVSKSALEEWVKNESNRGGNNQ